ncbi:unnamed protein product [Enterobius vermicularis]|uniref:Uncharacterized protein n=1 Tax=Enterobius vermicularis TaxID=51028 RepID=A0A3P6ID68_ENTVE|nr:unnamed protein product [Enterobius vermicularis]
MDAKRKLEKERSSAISESLKNLEHSSSKKFVFSSDSEDGVEVVVRSVTVFFLIFFFILRRYFGKKGTKIAELQSKYGHDKRFILDERFIDSDELEDYILKLFFLQDEEDKEIAERDEQMAILSSVLGKDVSTYKTSKKFAAFHRFDPENVSHLRWLNDQKTSDDSGDSVSPSVSKTYVFKDVFGQKEIVAEESNKQGNTSMGNSVENTVGDDASSLAVEEVLVKRFSYTGSSFFFLKENDPEVKEVVSNFRRVRPIESLKEKWFPVRLSLIKVVVKKLAD